MKDKPQRELLGYITVRGPQLESLWCHLAQTGGTSYHDLVQKYVVYEPGRERREDEMLRNALDFLHAIDLVIAADEDGDVVYKTNSDKDQEVSFRLLLLETLHAGDDGKGTAFAWVQKLIAEQDLYLVSRDDLRKEMEKTYPHAFSWTEEKIRFWLDLEEYIGLARRVSIPRSPENMACYPSSDLTQMMLREVVTGDADHPLSARDILDRLQARFMHCYTARGRVWQGLVKALLALERTGWLALALHADQPGAVEIGQRTISEIKLAGVRS